MFQRYLSIGAVPELRADPVHSEKIGNELEVVIPIDLYWEIEEIIKELRYARLQGNSTQKLWNKFSRLIYPCIVAEKERSWFRRNVQNKN
jgi:hypothetical protein